MPSLKPLRWFIIPTRARKEQSMDKFQDLHAKIRTGLTRTQVAHIFADQSPPGRTAVEVGVPLNHDDDRDVWIWEGGRYDVMYNDLDEVTASTVTPPTRNPQPGQTRAQVSLLMADAVLVAEDKVTHENLDIRRKLIDKYGDSFAVYQRGDLQTVVYFRADVVVRVQNRETV